MVTIIACHAVKRKADLSKIALAIKFFNYYIILIDEHFRKKVARMTLPPQNNPSSIEYTRRLWDNVIHWYSNADTKAQVILAVDGAFLAFLTGSIFQKPEDLLNTVSHFNSLTWILLILMVVSLFISIFFAIKCLWSRLLPKEMITTKQVESEAKIKGRYPPQVMWFFQHIAPLERDDFISTLKSIDADFEIEALGYEIHIVAGNVQQKHVYANRVFN
jgi:hypothetical protein